MKQAAFIGFVLFLVVGCQTAKVEISTEPADAKIYENGAYVGDGKVIYDTKQNQRGGSKELSLSITHPDYMTLNTTIENRFDTVYAVTVGILSLGVGGFFAVQGSKESIQPVQQLDYLCVGIDAGVAVYGILNSYKFDQSYHFVLRKKEE